MALRCDVRDKQQIHDVVDQAVEKFGTVDILVNNAQGGLDPVPWEDITDDVVATSLYSGPVASLRFMQACLPHMKEKRWGRIINTASGAARGGVNNVGHYAMAKGAIASLTYAAATDWSRFGITVNVIYPAVVTDAMKDWMAISEENRRTIESAFPVGFVGEPDATLDPLSSSWPVTPRGTSLATRSSSMVGRPTGRGDSNDPFAAAHKRRWDQAGTSGLMRRNENGHYCVLDGIESKASRISCLYCGPSARLRPCLDNAQMTR